MERGKGVMTAAHRLSEHRQHSPVAAPLTPPLGGVPPLEKPSDIHLGLHLKAAAWRKWDRRRRGYGFWANQSPKSTRCSRKLPFPQMVVESMSQNWGCRLVGGDSELILQELQGGGWVSRLWGSLSRDLSPRKDSIAFWFESWSPTSPGKSLCPSSDEGCKLEAPPPTSKTPLQNTIESLFLYFMPNGRPQLGSAMHLSFLQTHFFCGNGHEYAKGLCHILLGQAQDFHGHCVPTTAPAMGARPPLDIWKIETRAITGAPRIQTVGAALGSL